MILGLYMETKKSKYVGIVERSSLEFMFLTKVESDFTFHGHNVMVQVQANYNYQIYVG